jgi:hypothetical protein
MSILNEYLREVFFSIWFWKHSPFLFYKVIHHLVAIPYSNLLIPVDTRTRHTNPYSFRHIQTSKDCYKYSYFPRSIKLWNQFLQHLPLQTGSKVSFEDLEFNLFVAGELEIISSRNIDKVEKKW